MGSLSVARVRADCRLWGTPEAVPAFRERAGRALAAHLPAALGRAVEGAFDEHDETVWLVRRLHCSVLTNASAPADVLADACAASLRRSLARALAGDDESVEVRRFASRAAHLAAFVLDVVRGRAADRWYYASFAGLKLLAPSAAIRTALVAEPEQGLRALEFVPDRELGEIVAALSSGDEAFVLERFAAVVPPRTAEPREVARVVAAAWSRVLACGSASGRALAAFVRADSESRSPQIAQALVAPAREKGQKSRSILEADTWQAPWGNEVAAKVGDASPGGAAQRTDVARRRLVPPELPAGTRITTRCGGHFLLIRDADERPWDEWTQGWPDAPAATPARLLEWLVLTLVGGRARAPLAFEDAALRAVFGVPSGLAPADIAGWLKNVGRAGRERIRPGAEQASNTANCTWCRPPRTLGLSREWARVLASVAAAVLRRFASRLPGFAESTPEYLFRNVLAFEAVLEVEPERVLVRCGRPPLQLLLTLTGMIRGLVSGYDSEGRPLLLYPWD